MIPKNSSRPAAKIQKHLLAIGEPERIRDEAYTRSAKERNCMACELQGKTAEPGTVVLCHINIAGNFGRGLKASDDESAFLCSAHHYSFDTAEDRADWILRNLFLPLRKRAYQAWKATT